MDDVSIERVVARTKMTVKEMEAQIIKIRQEADLAASTLQANASEEIGQHKAEVESIKAKMASSVAALER